MTTSTIYPTGNPVDDANSDTVVLQAAIDAASDGDEIIMSDVLEGTSTHQAWLFGDTVTDNDVLYVARDGARITVGADFGPIPFYSGYTGGVSKQLIRVDKAITIKGVVDGGGDPLTELTVDNPMNADGTIPASWDYFNIVQFNKFSTIRDLKLTRIGNRCFIPIHPFRLENITTDYSLGSVIYPFVDNRATYAGYDSGAYSNPYYSYIKGWKMATGLEGIFIEGPSGVILEECELSGTIGWLPVWLGTGKLYETEWSNNVVLSHTMHNEIRNNTIDYGAGLGEWNFWGAIVLYSFWGGVLAHNKVFGNTITNTGGSTVSAGLLEYIWAWLAPYDIHDNVWYENSVSGYARMYEQVPFFALSTPYGGIVSDNTFVRSAGLAATVIARGSYAIPSYLGFAHNYNFMSNDFTGSNATGIAAAGAPAGTHIFTGWTSECTVRETGGYPVGLGGTTNFISDWGYQNRIVGEPANELEAPKGIGAAVKAQMEAQDHEKP
jgi:hypothetical protein